MQVGKIKKGQSILIHAGAGGIGHAALNIASHYGLEIFTTVSTEEKKHFLLSSFPCLKQHHIGNSRNINFVQMVMKQTRGRGVDVVLNCLAEEKLQASLRCLAKGGKFLEIGKFDLLRDNSIRLEIFKREASYHGVHLEGLLSAGYHVQHNLMSLLRNAIKSNVVKPLPRVLFGTDSIEAAFRFMTSGCHIGKVVIKIKEAEISNEVTSKTLMAIGRYYCNPEGCCIITGGLGGCGLEIIDWLIKRGARKFVISSRNGVKTGYQTSRIKF